MSRQGKASPRGGDPDENLRGRLREYKKQVAGLLRYIRYLEKQLGTKPLYQDVPVEEPREEVADKEDACVSCGSPDVTYIDTYKMNQPIRIKVCECGHRVVVGERNK